MKRAFLIFMIMTTVSASSLASARFVRETGGSQNFESVLRQTPFGSTVLPAIEKSLLEQGLVRTPSEDLKVTWQNNGQAFEAELWYQAADGISKVKILLSGELKNSLSLTKVQVQSADDSK